MPKSYKAFKDDIKKWLEPRISGDVLDVGPGIGTYSDLLSINNIDAVEIFKPYIKKYHLIDKYRYVYNMDIMEFDHFERYEWVILGDVLEHIKVEDAQFLINKITKVGCKCLVAVPYLFHQGESEGNIYEIHHQFDLTPRIMLERYPELEHLIGNIHYGYYVNFLPYNIKNI